MHRMIGREYARCMSFAKRLQKTGCAADMHETFGGGQAWEVADVDEEGRFTGMVYRVSVERSRRANGIVGKRPSDLP